MRARKQRIALFLLGLFFGVLALASAPSLHEWAHPHANSPSHECGVTLFTHGKVSSCDVAVEIFVSQRVAVKIAICPAPIFVSQDHPLPPSRGPPGLS